MGDTKVYHCLVKLYGDGLDFVFDTNTPDHDEYGVLTTYYCMLTSTCIHTLSYRSLILSF